MEEELDYDAAEDLPKLSDPFIQQYFEGRENLIAQEKKLRSDYAFKQSLSPVAAEAAAIVSRIRKDEIRTIWTPKPGATFVEEEAAPYLGMPFVQAKPRILGTRLFKIMQRMPKGALLHAHMDAMLDLDLLFDLALSTKGMHIFSTEALDLPEKRLVAPVSFVFSKVSKKKTVSLWNPRYEPLSLVPVEEAAAQFPTDGKTGFLEWIKSRCTITSAESKKHHLGVDNVWAKFKTTFTIINSIFLYEPLFRACLQRMFKDLLSDGIRWVDLRYAFIQKYHRKGEDASDEGYEEFFRAFGEELAAFKESEEGKDFWGARIIWTSIRGLDTIAILETMDECMSIKLEFPDLLSGFDLVGQEDSGRTLASLIPELFLFRKRCAEEGIDIPFFFHAGECLGDGDDTDKNLFDAILLGTRRIGHAFSLHKHPILIDMVKDRRILCESCPISNEVLRLTGSILSHTTPALLSRGVPVALSNDDPMILGQVTNGLSFDFWQALQGWESLGLDGLGSLAENSVRWAPFEDQTSTEWIRDIKDATLGKGVKAARMKEWTLQWERFCQWIIDEYGEEQVEINREDSE